MIVSLDIGGTNSRGEVLTWNGDSYSESLATATLPTPTGDGDAAVRTIVALIEQLLANLSDSQRECVAAVGVGVPGLIDSEAGVVRLAANLGWRNRALAAEVQQAVGYPVYVTHDVTAAGIAEQRLGAGHNSQDVMAVFLGTGIAAAFVSGGQLVRGGQIDDETRQPAGEIGHLPIVLDGLLCACGQHGCFEMYASARSFGRMYTEALGIDVPSPETKTSLDLVKALDHDSIAREVWQKCTRYLAHGLIAASMPTGPSLIILGGGLAAAGDVLVDAVRAQFASMATVLTVPSIVTAQLGQRAGTLGVALLTIKWLND